MIGAGICAYRSNFNCKEGSKKRPYKTSFELKLYELFIDRYRYVSKYDDDLFVCIAQWLMRKGIPNKTNSMPYPYICFVNDSLDNLDKFMKKALFSYDPFFAENLYINAGKFNLAEWRKQFNLFEPTKITGLKYYRDRASMPIPNFQDFDNIKKILFTNRDFYNGDVNTLKFSPNQFHKDAIWILKKRCYIYPNHLTYTMTYGCEDDFNNKSGSSWEINIKSEEGENFVDFCLRLHNSYDDILSGNMSKDSEYGSYYTLNEVLGKEAAE